MGIWLIPSMYIYNVLSRINSSTLDNPGIPNKRQVTMLIYLNEHWEDGDGGEIVLQPFLERSVVIPPLMDRAVIFLSDVVLHRVLPANKPRYCFTIWIDGMNVNKVTFSLYIYFLYISIYICMVQPISIPMFVSCNLAGRGFISSR
jgi:hypothetical protein